MNLNRSWMALALTIAAAVSGCGGGGGGSASAGTGTVGTGPTPPAVPPPVASSGLVPAAPAPGATLYADAAPLRVLRAGAVWTYHGIEQPSGTSSSEFRAYTNTVTHAAAATGVVESGSHPFNSDPESDPIRYQGGAYVSTNQIAFSENAPAQPIDVIELRSPVKVNDQYVSVDKHIADSGADLDGDKVNDALDVAVYSTVIGEETVDLPNRRQVKAIHVDMRLRARATYSKTGTTSPVYEALQSTWYAPGVGVIKSRVEEPNNNVGLPNRVVTEILENWDGLTEGLGHADTTPAAAPAGSAVSGPPLQYPIGVVGFDTQAVAVGYIPGQPLMTGLAVAQLDARGNVVATRTYTRAELFPAVQFFSEPRVVRVGNELRVLARSGNDLLMAALDATGQHLLRPGVAVVSDPEFGQDTDNTSYRVASDEAGMWIGWVRLTAAGSDFTRALVAQHIDANGQALGAVDTVSAPAAVDIHNLEMALDGSRLAFSWIITSQQPSWRLVTLDTGTGARVADQTTAGAYDTCLRMNIAALQPGLAATCSGLSAIGAARLDANGNPVLTSGATLQTDVLRAPWLGRVAVGTVFNGSGGQLIVSANQTSKFWPEDAIESSSTAVFETSGAGPLAASEPVLLARIAPAVNVQTSVKLGNRLLVIGSDNAGYMNSTVVWLPN